MSLYFAHSQITSYLVQGLQAARLATARDLRGWPYFEEAVSTLLKPSPPRGVYELPRWPFIRSEHAVASSSYLAPAEDPDLLCPLWGKVVRVTREDGGPIYQCKPLARTHKPAASVPGPAMEPAGGGDDDDDSLLLLEYGGGGSPLGPSSGKLVTREERSALAKRRLLVEHRRRGEAERLALKRVKEEALEVVRTSRAKPPPLAPSAFAAVLREKAFADGTDCAAISGLYREVMEDGFGGLEDLHLSDCGWDDGDVRTLARSLREVRVSEVRTLDLSHNHLWADGEALAEAFEAFHSSLLFRRVPLCTLRVLRLRGCKSLLGLPASLVRLHHLERLDLSGCEALRALPEQIGAVGSLLHIDCSECFSLGCLPESCGTLHALRYLNLDHCDSLTVLPDLSRLPKLEIDNLPDRLAMWHKCGRKGFDFMQTGPDPETTRHLNLSFLGTERLPAWLGALGNVCELNLTGCESLTSLAPVSRLARLGLLKLGGCRSLVTLRDACLPGLAFLRRLELFHCTGLLELPDLSKKVGLEVIGLPTHMEPWEEEGRLAFVFDPTAPPRPKKRGGGERRGGAQAGAGGGERSKDQGLGQGQDEAEPQQQKQVEEVNAEKDPAEAEAAPSEAAPLPADQSLELAFLDWGDPEVSQLAEALAAGSTICGRRFDPERVTELNLSDNTSVRSSRPLGRVLCQLPRLAMLRLSGCAQLSELPDEVGDCATLHTLDLQGCMSLRELPDALCGLGSTLAEIHLHRSGLRSLPQGFHRLAALRVLHISGRASSPCPIEELPASVCELTNLVEVSLVEFGHLLAVPDELFALPRLRVLTLGGFRAVTAPLSAAIGRAQALEHLSLQSWPSVVCLPEELGNCAELQSLTIGCQGVTTLPESIGRLQRLENLELKASAGFCHRFHMGLDPVLSSLPASFSQLAALKELALRGSFVRLPEVVGALPTLRRLNLAGSESMTSLCDSLPPTLEALSLSQCSALRSLPEAFSSLVCLQEANLLGCVELASLPDVSALTELTRLDLRLCFALQSLPSGLMDLHGCCVYLPVDEGVEEERTLIVGQR